MTIVNAQAAPSATTETDVFTLGAGKEAVISTISLCNRSSSIMTVRLALVKGGGATVDANYILYDTVIFPNDNYSRTCGEGMMAGDVLRVWASTSDLSITVSLDEGDIT